MLISQFYKDQDILITGGSGFIGKSLIEKILRSCPEFGNIYLLLRGKKGKTVEERLRSILKEALFDSVRAEQPQTLRRVHAINGDSLELGLGISKKDLKHLENVSIIFHSAASVRFDDHLKQAVLLNTRGTHELIKIAENLKYLKVFVHVSTTYCNPDKHVVEEKVYPPYADWRTTIKLAETYDTETLDVLNNKYSDSQPNTYTFTKSLAEHVINDYRDKLPVIIFRPSIVVSSIEEPIPGWVDNFNGPVGMLIACGLGIMRTNYAEPDNLSDFMPVDIVTRAMIIAAYKKGLNIQHTIDTDNQLDVFNCASAGIARLTMKEIVELGKNMVLENPFEKTIWVPGGGITRCRFWNFIKVIFLQVFMAILVDTGLRLTKQKPMLLKLQRRIFEASMVLNYFLVTEWEFKNAKFYGLQDVVPKSETEKFGFLHFTFSFDPQEFFTHAIQGARQILLHEPKEVSNGARQRLKYMKAVNYILELIAKLLIVRFVIRFIYVRLY